MYVPSASSHNWVNNPPSRVEGLSKVWPCPPRPSPTSISFIAQKNTPFALEWSIGHPNSFVYFAIVKREHESDLTKNDVAVFEDYLDKAPPQARSDIPGGWTYGPKYDKSHQRYACTLPNRPCKSPGKLPVPGVRPLKGFLLPGDVNYWSRPDDWRCSRMGKRNCNRLKIAQQQYSYFPDHYQSDLRAAYSNPSYPWLVGVMKYKITNRRPQNHDLAMLYFPPEALSGEYVIQYHWRGYYDCWDVLYDAETTGSSDGGGGGSSAAPPKLVTTNTWVKVDHCEYPSNKFVANDDVDCIVMKAGTSSQECMTWCEGKTWCNAVNVVRLTNPGDVRFPTEVNIPLGKNPNCENAHLLRRATDLGLDDSDAMVCYGIDISEIPEPDVGEKYTMSDDPRDPVFYSTCFRKTSVTSVVFPDAENASPTPAPRKEGSRQFRFGGKCLACADVDASVRSDLATVPKWALTSECKECKS
jgi:hypothetical protein